MKKLLIVVGLLFVCGFAHAEMIGRIAPTLTTGTVAISSVPGRICLSSLTLENSSAVDFAILDGTVASGTSFYLTAVVAATPFTQRWANRDGERFCGTWKGILSLNFVAGSATGNINYAGYYWDR